MMTPDQAKTVSEVYRRFMEGEEHADWDELDTLLEHLEYLDSDQIAREADTQLYLHKGPVSCGQEFCNTGCWAQNVVDAATYITDLYKKTGELHKNNRYVLEYYLCLCQLQMIVSA